MNLEQRFNLLTALGDYLKEDTAEWKDVKREAQFRNGWFVREFINIATKNIAEQYLDADKLKEWVSYYHLDNNITPATIGLVMAGNIPMVGLHDLLSVFITGHKQRIKLSSKDEVLIKHLVDKLVAMNPQASDYFSFEDRIAGCDAYIATGSNNTSRYFEHYFGKYPSIIRGNKTSVAVLDGSETLSDLEKLADDICLFFGLGCRNVTKLCVPENYDFKDFLNSFSKYAWLADNKKYKNNYDYYLTLLLMNKQYYMSNGVLILNEQEGIFSPISQLYYSFYNDKEALSNQLKQRNDLQCIVGNGFTPFGKAQSPGLFDYADGVDTIAFLISL
jgi:hypothetical protein